MADPSGGCIPLRTLRNHFYKNHLQNACVTLTWSLRECRAEHLMVRFIRGMQGQRCRVFPVWVPHLSSTRSCCVDPNAGRLRSRQTESSSPMESVCVLSSSKKACSKLACALLVSRVLRFVGVGPSISSWAPGDFQNSSCSPCNSDEEQEESLCMLSFLWLMRGMMNLGQALFWNILGGGRVLLQGRGQDFPCPNTFDFDHPAVLLFLLTSRLPRTFAQTGDCGAEAA